MHSEHFDTESLLEFLEAPDLDTQGCAAHLADCADCRRKAMNLSRLIATVPHIASDPQYDEAWMNEQARALDAPPAQDNRLYHFLHFRLSRQYAPAFVAPVAIRTDIGRPGWLQRTVQILRLAANPYPAMAFTALAALALALTLHLRTAPDAPVLATYMSQDYLSLEPRDSGMSLGFFDTASKTQRSYGKVDIQWSNDTLTATWPEVRDAVDYRFDLYTMHNATSKSVGRYNGVAPRASITSLTLEPGKHYQWRLSGTTSDDRQFRIEGGFVLNGGVRP